MHNKRKTVLDRYNSEKPKGRASKSKERAKRRVGRARSKKEGKRRAWETPPPPPPPPKEGSSAAYGAVCSIILWAADIIWVVYFMAVV